MISEQRSNCLGPKKVGPGFFYGRYDMDNNLGKKVVIGLSGGVDSSAAAWLLAQRGYDVIGVSMIVYGDGSGITEDAKKVADCIGIPYHVLDLRKEFSQTVIAHFAKEYREGRTPNPCVVCNRHIKWEMLQRAATELGAEYIATGHYAETVLLQNGRYTIRVAKGGRKDQTYALYGLTQEQLSHTIMPLGAFEKEEVRKMAKKAGLSVADKAESMEICFVPDGDYAGFLERECGVESVPGDFVDENGKKLGEHKGIIHYTIGQRKGLGIALGKPAFVTEIRKDSREVVLADNDRLFTKTVYFNDVNLMGAAVLEDPDKEYLGKIRYNHKGDKCSVSYVGDSIYRCDFEVPVRAVTPGQALVLYDGDHVAGGGTIILPDA